MKLTFEKISIKNFLSFEDETFNFDELEGMTIIIGKNNDIPGSKNGAGKSNLFSALVFALYGDIPNGLKRINIPNRMLPESVPVEVSLTFYAGNTKYLINRGLSKKYRTASCDIFRYDDEELVNITKSSIILTQKFINNEILKIDMSLFLRAMLLSADQSYNFFKLNAGQKREFIENLFGLDFYKDIYNKIHQDTIALSKDINIIEHDRINEEYNINLYKTELEKYTKSLQESQKSYAEKYDKVLAEYTDNSNKLKNIDKICEVLENKRDDLETNLRGILYNIDQINAKVSKYTTLVVKNETKLQNIESQFKKIDSVVSNVCDKCRKVIIDYTDFFNKKTELEKLNSAIIKAKTELDSANTELNEYTELKNKRTQEITDIIHKLQKADLGKNTLEVTNNKLKETINELKTLIKKSNTESNPYTPLIEASTKKLNGYNKKLKEYDTKYSYLEMAESIVSQDTIKKFIVADMLSLLNNRISYYLNKIGARYTCEFDENMDYSFITDSGEADYNNFSSGERARLAIATSFAFRDFMAIRVGVTSNILILDEYMDSNLDSLAINGLLNILTEFLSLYNQRVYVISHRHEIDESIFNNTIIVEKTNGISKLSISKTV